MPLITFFLTIFSNKGTCNYNSLVTELRAPRCNTLKANIKASTTIQIICMAEMLSKEWLRLYTDKMPCSREIMTSLPPTPGLEWEIGLV
jgi:hypothetical protein